jgi:hypothetical protein
MGDDAAQTMTPRQVVVTLGVYALAVVALIGVLIGVHLISGSSRETPQSPSQRCEAQWQSHKLDQTYLAHQLGQSASDAHDAYVENCINP